MDAYNFDFSGCPNYTQQFTERFGLTYDVYAIREGIHLIWSWGSLNHILLNEDWKGKTNRGLIMGATRADFENLYGISGECSFIHEGYYANTGIVFYMDKKEDRTIKLFAYFKEDKLVGLAAMNGSYLYNATGDSDDECYKAFLLGEHVKN